MRLGIAAAMVALPAAPAVAQASQVADAGSLCLQAASTAEAEWGLPTGLLAAIGRVESGRWEPATARVQGWPWTANIAGAGRYYASLTEAVADVTREQASGIRSIDVGCFQVNLMHHPSAFATLSDAFDPVANGRYAGRFLSSLRASTGSWGAAIAAYHSANPETGEPYRLRVQATLDGVPLGPAVAPPSGTRVIPIAPMPSAPARDPYVISIRASLSGTRGVHSTAFSDPHVIRIRG